MRYDKLKEIQQLMHGKVKQVVEPSSVRWLSVEACIKMVFEYYMYDSLVMSLEDEKSSNATATVLLIDVLSVIGTLGIANLSVMRHSVINLHCSGIWRNDWWLSCGKQSVGKHRWCSWHWEELIYKGVEIADNNNLRTLFNSVLRRYLNQLISNLHDRFLENDLELYQECFDVVLNPRRLPDGARELGNHLVEQLNKLCHRFETVLVSNRCKNQFFQFKHQVPSYRAVNFEQFTSCLIQEYKDPDFLQLV